MSVEGCLSVYNTERSSERFNGVVFFAAATYILQLSFYDLLEDVIGDIPRFSETVGPHCAFQSRACRLAKTSFVRANAEFGFNENSNLSGGKSG
jgi:hypothetical protein